MSRKAFAVIGILVLLASMTILWQRHSVESGNRQVALFMDGTDLVFRSRMQGLDLPTYLAQLKQSGLYGIASHVMPLLDLEAIGDVKLKAAGKDAQQYAQSLGLPAPTAEQSIVDVRAQHLIAPLITLVEELTTGRVDVYSNFIYTELPYERLRRASLGFPTELVTAVDAANLAFLPVFSPYSGSKVTDFAHYLETREFAGVMFTGNRLAEDLSGIEEMKRVVAEKELTVYWLQRSDTLRGYVPLEGIEQVLTSSTRIVRSYRISRAETDNPLVNPDNMVSRWLGSIKEYNTRAIYMRPFYREPDIAYNAEYVRLLAESVTRAGYTLGGAEPFARYYPLKPMQVLVGLGIGLMAFAVAMRFKFPRILGYLGVFAIALAQILLFTPYSLWLRLGLGLVGAIIASFAGIALFADGQKPWQSFVAVQAGTTGFALLTAAYLSDYDFIAEFEFFRGVKLQYTLPLVLLALFLWVPRSRTLLQEVLDEVKKIGPFVMIALTIGLGAALVFYVRRSGHVHSVSQVELYLRFWLDEVLVARPRFKELLAHPILLMVLYYRSRLSKLTYEAGLVAAAIGQVSIVNTFMHLRTPLALSLLRVFHGLWIGTLLGLAAILVTELVLRLWAKLR